MSRFLPRLSGRHVLIAAAVGGVFGLTTPTHRPRRVVVIGGGICGLLTGVYLRGAGHSVTILERDHIGSDFQASSINSGFIENESACVKYVYLSFF
jgi:hypothetical protein